MTDQRRNLGTREAKRLLMRARHSREPGTIRLLFRRVWSVLSGPFIWLNHRWRLFLLRRSGVDSPLRWRGRFVMRLFTWLTWILALIFLLWLARSAFVVIRGQAWSFPFDPDSRCTKAGIGVSCGAVTGFVTSLLSIALASAVFLLWRLGRVGRSYRSNARKRPDELVATAGTIIGEIVGRDELCRVIMEDLRDNRTRRPHVLVGGVGTGKTAVIVRLTAMLAERGAVPVPIQLRDEKELDFEQLARQKFITEVNERLASEPEGEKVFRRLLRDSRIVVLADGLEEALSQANDGQERDSKIRLAIHRAYQQHLPLLIASRPHDPLRGMDAAIYNLEPISEDAAVTYLEEGRHTEDERRLRGIVEAADVAESPLYLQITLDLYVHDMLDRIVPRKNEALSAAWQDRSRLRLGLLETWREALVSGYLYPEVPLNRKEREATIERLSQLACTGLKNDSLEVPFNPPGSDIIKKEVDRRLAERDMENIDMRLVAIWGSRLGLVESLSGGVRFQHSLIQAYLGSRLMDVALGDQQYVSEALGMSEAGNERPRPGREFLIALVLHSRRNHPQLVTEPDPASWQRLTPEEQESFFPGYERVLEKLTQRAGRQPRDNKALDIYAAALEIASLASDRSSGKCGETMTELAEQIRHGWADIHSNDPHTLEEAKLGLVRRFGEALRTVDEGRRRHEYSGKSGYAQLFDICRQEKSYSIRLAAAKEIGAGGSAAYSELQGLLAVPGGCRKCKTQRDYVRGGQHDEGQTDQPDVPEAVTAEDWRAQQVSAWITPLLVSSTDPSGDVKQGRDLHEWAEQDLDQWLRHVTQDGQNPAGHDKLNISEEIALAQGFKYAANRRPMHVHSRPEASMYLEEKALEMLKSARYWFSQLTLIQALCLWAMPDSDISPAGKPRSKPDDIIAHWLEVAGNKRNQQGAHASRRNRSIHPFVAAAADLASRALETERPERYVWIDESAVASLVGSVPAANTAPAPKHDLWIQPSMGWSRLDRRAQQLVADVLLFLNLTERDGDPKTIEPRLREADRLDLPLCITRDRRPLEPGRTVGTAEIHRPGTSCLGGCPFDLCPYPPKGGPPPRAELSEAFCRHQFTLLRRPTIHHLRLIRIGRVTAPWQGMSAREMREFWSLMADRARGLRPRGRSDK
jgi:hypothetical protein